MKKTCSTEVSTAVTLWNLDLFWSQINLPQYILNSYYLVKLCQNYQCYRGVFGVFVAPFWWEVFWGEGGWLKMTCATQYVSKHVRCSSPTKLVICQTKTKHHPFVSFHSHRCNTILQLSNVAEFFHASNFACVIKTQCNRCELGDRSAHPTLCIVSDPIAFILVLTHAHFWSPPFPWARYLSHYLNTYMIIN